jgi:DNA-directed RNA polymerase beta' subunit
MAAQQIVNSRRPRPLIHFRNTSDEPAIERGMVTSSLTRGFKPWEFFYHAQAGRESIVVQGTETATSGYDQRRLAKFMENVFVDKDGNIVNDKDEIIQLCPSFLPYDASKIHTVRDPLNVEQLLRSMGKK